MLKKRYLIIFTVIITNILWQNMSFADIGSNLNLNKESYAIDKWETLDTRMPTPRSYFSTAVHNDKIYIIGGDDEDYNTTNKVEVYDTTNNTWSTKANMLDSRLNHASIVVEDKIYVTGGLSRGRIVNTVQVYDIANDEWEYLAPMNIARDFHSLTVFNNKIYAIGGRNSFSGVYTNSIEEYDPEKNIWVNKTAMPVAADNVGVGILDDKIYCIKRNSQNTSGVYIYDPAEDSWDTGLDLKVPFSSSNIYNINDVFYIMSNETGYMYDPEFNTVEKRQVSLRDSYTAYSAMANDKIYVFEGETPDFMMEGVVMVYTPVAAYEQVLEAVNDSNPENLNTARHEVNRMPEGKEKNNLQTILNNVMVDLDMVREIVSANLDVYIKSENMLSLSLDTNSVSFEGYSGAEPIEKLGAVSITINSSLPYNLNAYMPAEISNSDGSEKIPMDILNIKESTESIYKQFENTDDKVILKESCAKGNGINHSIDLRLDSSDSHKADIYKTVIKFEAEQK